MNRVIVIRNGKVEYMARPRKKGERDASGRLKKAFRGDGETVAQIRQTAVLQRIKMLGANENNALDQQWGSPLGKLRMDAVIAGDDSNGLSERQYEAIKRYILARARYWSSQGLPAQNPKSIAADLVSRGISLSADNMDDEQIYAIRRDYNGARSALLEYAGRGVEYVNVLDMLARDQMTPFKALGTVREAANILARHYGM